MTKNQINVFDLLSAPGPFEEYSDKLHLYGQFVGSWDIDAVWYEPNGQRKGKGEWHFAWILGGRGIQDVLFASGEPQHQFGTSLRCYDASLDAWHISWMQPAGGEFVHLLGRKIGDRIVQESIGDDHRRDRWSFNDITPDTFLWKGEVSFDNGMTWTVEQEMRAIRR
ncbi:MAG: hypothetical protein ACM3SY_21005 [Candidatus Omnitrophota bacterium]